MTTIQTKVAKIGNSSYFLIPADKYRELNIDEDVLYELTIRKLVPERGAQ